MGFIRIPLTAGAGLGLSLQSAECHAGQGMCSGEKYSGHTVKRSR